MKNFKKWRSLALGLILLELVGIIILLMFKMWQAASIMGATLILFSLLFIGFWNSVRSQGIKTELDVSRVLGKDAKDALNFGDIGIIIYDDEYKASWCSAYFKDHDIHLDNKKLTSWIPAIKQLFDEEEKVDIITGKSKGQVFEIARKSDSQVLFVKDITRLYELEHDAVDDQIVIGMMQLDNYIEYQSYENEEIIESINTHLRAPIISWAKENDMFVRRLRSDRVLLVLNYKILEKLKAQNFSILQLVKDEAVKMDVSITLSMGFAYGTKDLNQLDNMVNELMELAQSRGGDQCAIRRAGAQVQFIGGNSELSSQRSKVRVRIMAQSIQEAMKEAGRIFIAGHINSDFDCMGAAIAMADWAKTLGKEAFIVLKDVPRDKQLEATLEHYAQALKCRLNFITPAEAKEKMDKEKDLLILVDHSVPAISSARSFVDDAQRVMVIDHHRRNDAFVDHPMLTYIESTASSTCELLVELLQNTPHHVPVYEADATIMYLGVLVDTNRFTMHTSARTFETAAQLRNWGANTMVAEKALCEDIEHFTQKNYLASQGRLFADRFMILACPEPLNRTMMSQISDALLKIKGAQASFTIAVNADHPDAVAISARSDGSFNVQKIMEKMGGGGHFAAAALERKNTTVAAVEAELKNVLEEEIQDESHTA